MRLAHAEITPHNLRTNSGDYKCLWQASDWPNWSYILAALPGLMVEVSHAQGLLLGRLADVGMALRDQARSGRAHGGGGQDERNRG